MKETLYSSDYKLNTFLMYLFLVLSVIFFIVGSYNVCFVADQPAFVNRILALIACLVMYLLFFATAYVYKLGGIVMFLLFLVGIYTCHFKPDFIEQKIYVSYLVSFIFSSVYFAARYYAAKDKIKV